MEDSESHCEHTLLSRGLHLHALKRILLSLHSFSSEKGVTYRDTFLIGTTAPSVSFIEVYTASAASTINSWHSSIWFLRVSDKMFHSTDEINELKQEKGPLFLT